MPKNPFKSLQAMPNTVFFHRLPNKISGLIHIPGTSYVPNSKEGRVISAGRGKSANGRYYDSGIKTGDKVYVLQYDGKKVFKYQNLEIEYSFLEQIGGVYQEPYRINLNTRCFKYGEIFKQVKK